MDLVISKKNDLKLTVSGLPLLWSFRRIDKHSGFKMDLIIKPTIGY